MSPRRRWLFGCILLLTVGGVAFGFGSENLPIAARESLAVPARIDQRIAAVWAAKKIKPVPLADDAEFLRRVYLDLIGRIPSVDEARAFFNETSPDKRPRLVDRLLDNPRYATHWSHVWRRLMMPEASASAAARALQPGFEAWLEEQLASGAGYDQMVRELLTTPIGRNTVADAAPNGKTRSNVMAYYLAKDASPENLAAGTARVFLGVRLECAQCHDHPFASWKRDQFWGYAAFFASIQKQTQGDLTLPSGEIADRWELAIPGTDRVAPASYPDGSQPIRKFRVRGRQTLAAWMTAPKNPYFARATVNRMWCYFFGRGLVDPVDDMIGGESTSSHPELLDELAHEFAERHFDLKFLIRTITASRAYQLTSAAPRGRIDNPATFARMAPRGLTAEQLFDSLRQATGFREKATGDPSAKGSAENSIASEEFLSTFGGQNDRPTEYPTSILQALAMMNGRLIGEQITVERSETLAGALKRTPADSAGQIETLYLAALSRKPRSNELEKLTRFLESSISENGSEAGRKSALTDVFWTLLNSSEFILNH
jgi:hypothetical protein